MFLNVTNNGRDTFKGPTVRYDGRDYEFPPGVTVTVTIDAARHIFGLGLENKANVLMKHGWMMRSDDMERAMQRLNQFSFTSPDENSSTSDAPKVERAAEKELEQLASEVETEQGTAPLQTGSVAEADVPDGASAEVAQPTPSKGGSMLDNLSSFLGGK